MALDEQRIREVVQRVIKELFEGQASISQRSAQPVSRVGDDGIFQTPNEAVEAAAEAQKKLLALGLDKRRQIIEAIRQAALKNARRLAEMAREETKMGKVEHKVAKNEAAALLTPGMEDLEPEIIVGPKGTTIQEYVPFGVILSITPMTNPTSFVISHAILMIAGGNAVVISPHPQAKECTKEAIRVINRAIVEAGGPPNLVTAVAESSIEVVQELMKHPKVDMVTAAGGPGVCQAALQSGKKAIVGGPGNPPVLVDETADIAKAAADIIKGASFDNDILCIGEKVIIAVDSIADNLMRELKRQGAYEARGDEAERIINLIIADGKIKREVVGLDAGEILRRAGIITQEEPKIIVIELSDTDHPLVMEEQLLPVLPFVRVRNFEEGLRLVQKAEQGFKHTSILHSRSLPNILRFRQEMHTNYCIINGPSTAAVGTDGEGYLAMTVASTGEGPTRPRDFCRRRRFILTGGIL
ncbi:aldehyde dehydrogenase [bacterium]|nr:aldehyde dehydrogenase [bacterium]